MKAHAHVPNLDGLRFVAALAVVIGHIAQISSIFALPSLWHFRPVMLLGDTAVSVFFVLSGFLITHPLLEEGERTGTIGFFGFYRRRALRILPVYVAVCVLSFFIIPYFSLMDVPGYAPPWTAAFWKSAALYAVLSPHVAAPIYPGVRYFGMKIARQERGMEEKIATWTVAVFVAVFVALIIYGCTMDLFEAETIRATAETGIVVVALGVAATFLRT